MTATLPPSSPHSRNTFIWVGAILLSLNFGAGNATQDLPAQPPLAAAAAPSILPPAASPIAPKLAGCSADGEFYVFATPEGRIKYGRTDDAVTLRTFYMCKPEAVALSPDGRLLAVVGKSTGFLSKLKVWNVKDGSLLHRFETGWGADLS